MMKHCDESNMGRKGRVWLTLPHHSPSLKDGKGASGSCFHTAVHHH